jgi:hypothetical protein
VPLALTFAVHAEQGKRFKLFSLVGRPGSRPTVVAILCLFVCGSILCKEHVYTNTTCDAPTCWLVLACHVSEEVDNTHSLSLVACPIWSGGQISSDLVRFGPTSSDLVKPDRISCDLVSFGPTSSDLVGWSDLIRFDLIWSDFVRSGQTCSDLVRFGLVWSDLA